MEVEIWLFLLLASLAVRVNGQCSYRADIVLAIPASGPGNNSWDVPPDEFNSFEDNIINLINHFDIGPNKIQVGLILYGRNTVTIASPQPYKNRQQINTRVTLMMRRNLHRRELGSGLNVKKALKAINKMLIDPPPGHRRHIMRPGARRIGIVFVRGASPSSDIRGIMSTSMSMKREGITLYAVGANATGLEFSQIGTDFCRMQLMDSFKIGLPSAIPELASGICSELDPGVIVKHGNCFPRQYGEVLPIPVICERENNMLQPDPNNCAYFYQCAFYDAKPVRGECSDGTIFDPIANSCNYESGVACLNDISCPKNQAWLHPYPMNCSKFINCFHDRVPHVQVCPTGLRFDYTHQSCNLTSLVPCIIQK